MEDRIKQLEQRVEDLEKKVAAGTTTNIGLTGERICPNEFAEILRNAPVVPISKAVAKEIS